MRDPTELLNHIALKTMELKVSSREGGWRWREGITLFVFPEARCPRCENWIQTNRVWLVDEKWRKLLYCWHRDGTLVDPTKNIVHPHVNSVRRICVGDNDNPSTALFAGISPGNHYQSTEVFFWELGHDCPKVPKTNCDLCRARFVNVARLYGENSRPLCSQYCYDVAYMFRCWACFDELPFYDGHGRDGYCETCYMERTTPCGLCDGRVFNHDIRTLPTGEIVCASCAPNSFSRCSYCQAEHHNSLLDMARRCESCNRRLNGEIRYCACDCGCGNEVDSEGNFCNDCNDDH